MLTAKIRIHHTAKKWKIVSILSTDFVAEDDITTERVGFFAILDGHGGSDVSEYCAKNLPQVYQ
jgi:serine/threonine protein phosphatase PrpC